MKRSLLRRVAAFGFLLLLVLALSLPVAAEDTTTATTTDTTTTTTETQPTEPEKTNTDIFSAITQILNLLTPESAFNTGVSLFSKWLFSQAVDVSNMAYDSLTSTLGTAFFENEYILETLSFFQWVAGILLTFGFVSALIRLAERNAHGELADFRWLFFSAVQAYGMILFCKPAMLWLNELFYNLADMLTNVSTTVSVTDTLSSLQPDAQSQIIRSLIVMLVIVVVSVIVLFKALQRFVIIYIQTTTGYFYVFDLMQGNNVLGEWGRDVISGFVTFGFQYILYRIGMVLIVKGVSESGIFVNFTNSNFVVGLCFLLGVGAVALALRRWGYANQPSGIKQALGQAVSMAGSLVTKFV